MSVELHINSKVKEATEGRTLFEEAEDLGIHVPTSCRKQGKCKECLVEVMEGMECLSAPTEAETHLAGNFRLSCQSFVHADSGIFRCHTMRRGEMKIEHHAYDLPVSHLHLTPDPAIRKEGDKVLMDGKEIDRSSEGIFGIAMDLGTTTIVLRLFDLENGEVIADASFENPQRFGGSDVLARIHYDTEHKGKLLQRTLIGYLNRAIEEFPVDTQSIYEVVVAGNSTMRDLFFRLDVYSIGQNPYQSITEIEMAEGKRTSTSVSSPPKRLGLKINQNGRIYSLPIISGHVGADAAACMLALNIGGDNKTIAIMDIGTNTELILGNKENIMAASCPAGPAFEGGNLRCGMPGLPGAIEKVKMNEDGTIDHEVIGDEVPAGICGSGLIDVLSELMRTSRMNTLGRFEDDEEEVVLDDSGDDPVYVHESDINELAQAKGANVAGLHILFNSYGLQFKDIDAFYLAGGFGRHIDIDASKRIGLIPDIENEKIVQVGNASIEGASIALLSVTRRKELEQLISQVQHCRLEADPHFFEYFVEGCQFTRVESLDLQQASDGK